ncbi:MAG: 3'(2'),5'-bisphosphate nucleotidase CysQ [Alphaproteobacteria bacterium]|jgi:3'(2'), 5'-bisphosphate nucleotidase|uniref:3'(2'),5'-bisphosphate nucleotidase CysQ n=2 Tax=Brevundimonas TaxID=41275 RepID=A0A7Z8Y5W6_9CAUL|nr:MULTISPECIES: 3'(2'),5'-bisphosphate nucleotidase CysQ [Brevundimonas]MBU4196016.1 3'(2'),5'-bisphosphate nucleotidase CysQ [Alphaproteobacteria bacterium]MBJ7318999.1 3'(2'),5'-bisphosphate nucleotidase CysQ [Brevundimonas sp.]MBU4238172.1 3'(2'),5'-bisphosphate nucleotidase CysQ [Alphaproteobacteria bacterium]PZN98303.1 MAG: 3'(2'),5'-bisphosphate nucleotidase [Alphaproteobacteria bacterium]VDC51547.1 3'(2'),5'-bisphosphate nucleotidase CysQ [Brevundimonas mediterranea]
MTTSPTNTLALDLESGALALAIAEIAEDAARLILPYWRSNTAVETKSDDSPVTQADRAAEALILERLAALYPGVQTVAEEAVAANGAPASAEDWFWLIDPLDGTKGFVRGGEAFTVNIALMHAGYPVAGVVTAPATATTWRTDTPGGGAFRRQYGEQQEGEAHAGAEWRPIKVRDRPQEGMALLSHSVTDEEAARLAARHGCTRWQGTDSSLKFCLIAEGRFDAYPRSGPTSEWDTAAGQAVLEAAGGRVLADDGQRLAYGKPKFLNGPFVAMGG